ncbi:hypothetical protein ACLOJK_012344 [Asimina triloba]
MCKIVYEATNQVTTLHFKGYAKLSRAKLIEWNSRGISTCHALIAAVVSFYLLFLSDLFQEGSHVEPAIERKSVVSEAIIGLKDESGKQISLIAYDAGNNVYTVLHHGLSLYSIILSLGGGKAQIYILLVLFTEITTPLTTKTASHRELGENNFYNGLLQLACGITIDGVDELVLVLENLQGFEKGSMQRQTQTLIHC